MTPALPLPDARHLVAAEGWLELGNPVEAEAELEAIAPELKSHFHVLAMRWAIHAAAKRWEACVEVGRVLIEQEPDNSLGWVNRAYALRRAPGGGVQIAYDALRAAADRQLDESEMVFFNLACYACQLGRLEEARAWLAKCFAEAQRNGRGPERKREALAETDLEPLWKEIKGAA